MADIISRAPHAFQGVMISSTFTDLHEHRKALKEIIDGSDLKAVVMENDAAKPEIDVVDSSLRMVQKAAAYVGVIGHKYGQTPACPKRNPNLLSLTELEFEEAVKLGRPILLFLMGEDHPVTRKDVEVDSTKLTKLNAFRERAKIMGPDSQVHRIYATFESLDDFKNKAARSVAELTEFLRQSTGEAGLNNDALPRTPPGRRTQADLIPAPPAFYAEPAYLGSHEFVGRRDQLESLDGWALPVDSHPVLLFEAIGGTGKSMLTWEWVRNRAPGVRKDWAGRFWYSFYERGAIMADFCQRALAYITGQPMEELRKTKTSELGRQLIDQLRARPWLLVLDGLERVLVAYHRIDAAQLRDEDAGRTDEIAHRDVCAAIRPEDDDLLRALAGAAPSKLLLTSRLTPRVLLNKASQPIPGVHRVLLPGLRPTDAEALFRACGVSGESKAVQAFLKTHCDCHPLTVGVLAGLVKDYLPHRGDFDRWSTDPDGGGRLNLAELDLVQKRNHILLAAIAALSQESRQLLSIIALLSEAVDYETLKALNPHLPPEIQEVPVPEKPEENVTWILQNRRADLKKAYLTALRHRAEYEKAVQRRLHSAEFIAAPKRLAETIKDLENRGLLQYDSTADHYDLHPVLRGVAAGGLAQTEKETYGQRVVDHFSSLAHDTYEQANTLEDVRDGLHIVRTLLQMRRYEKAYDAYRGGLSKALLFNLEAHAEVVALLRPFFQEGWNCLPGDVEKRAGSYLANAAAIALRGIDQSGEQLLAFGSALAADLSLMDWRSVRVSLGNIATALGSQNRLAKQDFCINLAFEFSTLAWDKDQLFKALLDRFSMLAKLGQWMKAEDVYRKVHSMDRPVGRAIYRAGNAEYAYALFRFWQGELDDKQLAAAERPAHEGRSRALIRSLHGLRGAWRLELQDWKQAAESLHEAVVMARAVGRDNAWAEAQLALANLRLGRLSDPHHEVERLASLKRPAYRILAELCWAIGDPEQAKRYALTAYRWAWADGEPFVRRHELEKTRGLLQQFRSQIPDLPHYESAKDGRLPWEEAVVAALAKLKVQRAAAAGVRKKI